MHDDRVGGQIRALGAGQRAALQPVLGVGDARLIGRLAHAQPLDADAQPLGVHHGEHGRHALVGLADQPAPGVLEGELACGGALQAHLVLDTGADHAVALAWAAVFGRDELGDHEQADALGARRRVRQLGQDQVDDVLGQVVLAGRDEYLGAVEPVAAVAVRRGLGAQQAKIGAAVRFGQAHGAGPNPLDHLRKIGRLEVLGGVRLQGADRALGQAGIEAESDVGGRQHLLDHLADALGQALAAPLGIEGQRRPAAVAEGVVGRLEAGGGADHAVLQHAALGVTDHVGGQDDLGGELGGLLQYAVDQIGGGVGELRIGVQPVVAVQLVQHEAHVAEGSVVGLHLSSSTVCRFPAYARRGRASRVSSAGAGRRNAPAPASCPR